MANINLNQNPEFIELLETALADYQLWFDEDDPSDQPMIESIDTALQNHDYLHCDALDDALSAWHDNLVGIMESTSNQDDIKTARYQLQLIGQYFAA